MTMPPVSSNADSDPVDRRRKFHRSLFDWCLDRADLSLQAGNDSAAAKWLHVAARSADTLGCGQLISPRLEETALALAMRLGELPGRFPLGAKPLRWLHVMSIGYAVGGHTTMLRRWIVSDDSDDEHHLALTFMDKLALPELSEAVEQSGGKVTLLGGDPSLLERARKLRDLAWRNADRVVLHSHMWDVVPTIAFGVAGGPPVLLVNHADHTFWVGAAITDLVVNLRRAGEELTIRNRGLDRSFLFRIPLAEPSDPLRSGHDRAAIRERLNIHPSAVVFLTIGSAYKYLAVGDLDFVSMAKTLLTRLPEAYLVAVGPSAQDADWKAALRTFAPRLIPVGEQRPATSYHAAADIYLEGFPFDSHTALLEAAVSGLPVVRIPATAVPPFSGHHFPLSAVPQPANVEGYLRYAISLSHSSEMRRAAAAALHDAVVGLQCGTAWRARLGELKSAVPARHAIRDLHAVDTDRELDRFWTMFQMRRYPIDPLRFVLGLAADEQLDSGPGLKLIQAEYRSQLGRQSMKTRARNFLADRVFGVNPGRLGTLHSLVMKLKR
jgi:hypothetical protein